MSKLVVKNGAKVTLNLSSNVIGDSNVETNFPLKLLLTGFVKLVRIIYQLI